MAVYTYYYDFRINLGESGVESANSTRTLSSNFYSIYYYACSFVVIVPDTTAFTTEFNKLLELLSDATEEGFF